jgi:hypothetical protein
MQSLFSNALSKLFSQPLSLSTSRRERLAWLVLLVMRQGTVCLLRLAAHGRKASSRFALGLKTFCKALASPSRFTAKRFLHDLLSPRRAASKPKIMPSLTRVEYYEAGGQEMRRCAKWWRTEHRSSV